MTTNLDFEGEVLLHVLDDHDEKGKLDAQGFLCVRRTCHVGGAAQGRRFPMSFRVGLRSQGKT